MKSAARKQNTIKGKGAPAFSVKITAIHPGEYFQLLRETGEVPEVANVTAVKLSSTQLSSQASPPTNQQSPLKMWDLPHRHSQKQQN